MQELLIALVVFLVVSVLILYLVKQVVKSVILIMILFFAIIAFLGFFVVTDMLDFKEKFPAASELFLLENEGKIIAGFSGKFNLSVPPVYLTASQLASCNSFFEKNDFKSIIGDNYKIFIISRRSFDSLDSISLGDKTFTRDQIYNILDSPTSLDDFLKQAYGDNSLTIAKMKGMIKSSTGAETNEEFRAVIFTLLIGKSMESNPLFLIQEYKNSNLFIYPETAMFKLIKILPFSMIDFIIKTQKPK